ncbi:hypothetical protein FSC845_02370 [Francisella persica ATCC VR-331]|nr:hypothetical protein FSC845_02370 [Francisella persica ATCC VR-331]
MSIPSLCAAIMNALPSSPESDSIILILEIFMLIVKREFVKLRNILAEKQYFIIYSIELSKFTKINII